MYSGAIWPPVYILAGLNIMAMAMIAVRASGPWRQSCVILRQAPTPLSAPGDRVGQTARVAA
jgi:hypothetical protein